MITLEENKLVKFIGLTADELINFAAGEHPNRLLDKEEEIMQSEGVTELEITKEMRVIINEEAMLETVAAMIERNNQVLLQHLKQLGVVSNR
jgi:hypothetical protein